MRVLPHPGGDLDARAHLELLHVEIGVNVGVVFGIAYGDVGDPLLGGAQERADAVGWRSQLFIRLVELSNSLLSFAIGALIGLELLI
jgi:hypothetical protein